MYWTKLLVILGDFNARVGVLKEGEKDWGGVLGKHGLDEMNERGEELLQFCAMNQLTVMNTCFKNNYGTWMHPGTKVDH